MSTRRGHTRIPVFETRRPDRLPSPTETLEDLNPTDISRKSHELNSKDIGKRVRIADKEGTLRYVGSVGFASGIWCGVELETSVGKHDGCVRGVRYFSCPPLRGLMATVAKVSLVDEIAVDAVSGPYSMIFDVREEPVVAQTAKSLNTTIVTVPFNKSTLEKDLEKTLVSNEITASKLEKIDYTIHSETISLEKSAEGCFVTFINQDLDVTINNDNNVKNFTRTINASVDSNETIDKDVNDTVILEKRKVPSELYLKCNESFVISMSDTFERPRSYPTSNEYGIKKSSTPVRIQSKKSNLSPIRTEEDPIKRDSFDCDESLGILSLENMNEMSLISRSPSSENIQSLPKDPNKDLSILDINDLSLFMVKPESKALDLGFADKKDFTLTRIEQTPSPEELPLDPTPIVEIEPKQVQTKTNFITSITSITSIDTGYQGDGEMSRPASRGADNSPLTRRPLPRPQPRRPDPMTDSDFYTESDADHEDHKGDRKAQVIDGTLYGPDAQSSADIYNINQRENMDSSGIFTDLESNKPEEKKEELSPSQSTKTISDTSPNENLIDLQSPDSRNVSDSTVKEMPLKRHSPSPSSITSSPTSVRSPRHVPKEDCKKYKVPKRNVTSKVKALLDTTVVHNPETKPQKKVGRWDAVMNKISKNQGEQLKHNLKEIKSKVFSSIHVNVNKGDGKEIGVGLAGTSRQNKSPNNKTRRTRIRSTNVPSTTTTVNTKTNSINSSLSDLSGASPIKKCGSAKKQREDVRVFRPPQILLPNSTPKSLTPNRNTSVNNLEAKKPSPASNDAKTSTRKNLFNSKEKKKEPPVKGKTALFLTKPKCNRTTVKGGRVSPTTRSPPQQRAQLKAAPKTAEALAVLVQHLVFELEAFRVPSLKKEVQKVRTDAEEARLSCQHLEEKLLEVNAVHAAEIEEERAKYRSEITSLLEQHRNRITQLKNASAENEQKLRLQIQNLSAKYENLEKEHQASMNILREENDSIREQIDEKNGYIESLKLQKGESEKFKRSYKDQVNSLMHELVVVREENDTLLNHSKNEGNTSIQEVLSLRAVLDLKQTELQDIRKALATATQKAELVPALEEKANALSAKCEDLVSQLDRKNICEIQLVREKKKLEESLKEELNQKRCLIQRNEELQWKLQQNKEVVTKVIEQAEEGSFNRSILSTSFNERHMTPRHLERTLSFRETKPMIRETTINCRKSKNSYDLDFDDISPPSSPKVKGVVEKSDSVSYVLEMDESPEVVASRIVRRSFRNTTPPKSTPTKSPSNKRARMKTNPLSLSSSAGAIVSNTKIKRRLSNGDCEQDNFLLGMPITSTPMQRRDDDDNSSSHDDSTCKEENLDIDEEHDVHVQIPSLPSEIGRNNNRENLPMPKHLAGETMIFEMNSDDESTTSSSSGQL
ncbi:CAP-Gly domain-containing linker protein 1 isoform X1 [Onthophagus taurus]|uniref:CAP-Gly domain-containing linker protein 1 isoform X1 n=2 Tax=Onthophagus taurus TaxID=166361 RepID=UPI0039BE2307